MVYVFFVTTKLQQYGLKVVHAKSEEHMIIFEFSSNLKRGSNALCRHKKQIFTLQFLSFSQKIQITKC